MFSSLLWLLFSSTVIARTIDKCSICRRQDGPVDPGIPSDCTYYDTAVNKLYDCTYFEENWGISHAQFVLYVRSILQIHVTILITTRTQQSWKIAVASKLETPTVLRSTTDKLLLHQALLRLPQLLLAMESSLQPL